MHGRDALRVQTVQPASALRPFGHQSRLFEQTQVTRDRRAADRQLIGELLDRSVTVPQELDYGPPVGVAKSVEGISGESWECDLGMVTNLLP